LTPAELDRLRIQLPVFGRAGAAPVPFFRYLEFYGLDFVRTRTELEHSTGTVGSGEYQLLAHRWIQPRATHNLLLVHGYFDHSGIYNKLIEWALDAGCNVLIFDLPGHGLSSGQRAEIEDFAQYGLAVADILAAVELPPLPLCAIGQSTGCAALMELARRQSWPFLHTAFLAPLVRPAGWLGVRIGQTVLKPFKDSIGRKFNQNSSDQQFLDFIRRDPLQHDRVSLRWITALKRWLKHLEIVDLGAGPVLVVQGEKDGTVKWRYNVKAVAQLFPGSEFYYLPQAGHQLANESIAIREQYQRELQRYLLS
jgi:alpha-beta hydrolase superfamily lysophospholipase